MVESEKQKTGPVAEAFELYLSAANHWDRELVETGKVSVEVITEVFDRADLVLRAYCLPENWEARDPPTEHLPLPLVRRIADQIRYIVAGKLPDPIAALIGRGSPGIGPIEDQDIGIAVAYIKLAKSGAILDHAPVRKVCRKYGVTDGAVRKWQRRLTHIDPSVFWPYAVPEDRAQLIADSLEFAAKRYRFAGRGSRGRAERPKS